MKIYLRLFCMLLGLSLLFGIQLSSAITLNTGAIINTTVSNSSLTFDICTFTTTTMDVEEDNITLVGTQSYSIGGNTYSFSNYVVHDEVNKNYNCNDIALRWGELESDGTVDNTFKLTFTMISAGLGAVISLLLIIGTFMMLLNGSMGLETFIKCLVIEVMMFLVAGTIVLLGI